MVGVAHGMLGKRSSKNLAKQIIASSFAVNGLFFTILVYKGSPLIWIAGAIIGYAIGIWVGNSELDDKLVGVWKKRK